MISVGKIRIAIVDDHPLFRAGVIHVLESSGAFEVVGEGTSISDALSITRHMEPDVVLLDIGIQGGGLAAATAITQSGFKAKVVILTASESGEDVFGAMQAGARGYLVKGISSAELVRVMSAVHRGEMYVMPELAARVLQRSRTAKPNLMDRSAELSGLTYREDQIVKQIARGLTNKEIARHLNVSEKTIKHHMTNIMQKLRARNRVEVALVARSTQPDFGAVRRI